MMKKLLLITLLLMGLVALLAIPMPRIYVQRLVLEDGSMPLITQEDGKSANEYIFTAQIVEIDSAFVSTETHPIQTIAIKKTGNGESFPFMVIANIQLGNFRVDWKAGQTLHMELTHKTTGQKVEWDLLIPEGSNLIRHLEEPIIIPPLGKAE